MPTARFLPLAWARNHRLPGDAPSPPQSRTGTCVRVRSTFPLIAARQPQTAYACACAHSAGWQGGTLRAHSVAGGHCPAALPLLTLPLPRFQRARLGHVGRRIARGCCISEATAVLTGSDHSQTQRRWARTAYCARLAQSHGPPSEMPRCGLPALSPRASLSSTVQGSWTRDDAGHALHMRR